MVEPTDAEWTADQLATLKQRTLFGDAPAHTLEKIPFNFKYEFQCSDVACRGHTMTCFVHFLFIEADQA